MNLVKTAPEIAIMRKAGRVVAEMLDACQAAAKPGVTTLDLDQVARGVLEKRNAKSNFLNYHGFPAVICTSPNDVIVHGIPGNYVLEEGDIVSIDAGAIIDGWHGDAARTVPVGEISAEAKRLIEITERALWAGIDQMKNGNRLFDIGGAVQEVAEGAGYSVVREYVGHGIGRAMHEQPQIPNYRPVDRSRNMKIRTGQRVRGGAHGQRRQPQDRAQRRRLDRGHRRRPALGPLRALHRRHRRRPRSPHRPVTLGAVSPRSAVVTVSFSTVPGPR